MTESPKLLPCPFCQNLIDPPDDGFHVGCANSDCTIEGLQFSIREWNCRAPDPEREAMAKVCEAAQALIDQQREMPWYGCEIKLRDALADLERARKGEP